MARSGRTSGTTGAPKGTPGMRKASGTTGQPKGGGKYPSPNSASYNPPPFPVMNNKTTQLHQRHGSGSALTGSGQHTQAGRGAKGGASVKSAGNKTSVAFRDQPKPF